MKINYIFENVGVKGKKGTKVPYYSGAGGKVQQGKMLTLQVS